ncbi:MAG: carboxypeptidase regulatory-like domain-containing protein [Treponema sp.]|nr:carboxypeptidase regulatory-like domain-containing protein [Candidatus Treponema equifaecale]
MNKFLTKFLLLQAILFALLFAACSDAGGGDESPVPKASISGKVVYSNSSDSSGINVSIEATDGLRAVSVTNVQAGRSVIDSSRAILSSKITGSDGSFHFSDLEAGTYTIYASSNSSSEKAVYRNVTVEPGKETTVEDLKLTATGTISGKISVNDTDSENAGFLVFIGGTSYMAMTGSDGSFVISGVPAKENYQVLVTKGISTYSWKSNVTVSANSNTDLDTFNISKDELPSDGKDGENGKDGISIIWLGSFANSNSIENPKALNAYYNTTDGCSYIYDGTQWTLLAKAGDKGDEGNDGVSIVWRGSFENSDSIENPKAMNAYYNTTDGCSYIYDGTQWTLLAKAGENNKDLMELTTEVPVGAVVFYEDKYYLVTHNSYSQEKLNSVAYSVFRTYNTVKDSESRKKYLKEYEDIEEYIELYKLPDESNRNLSPNGESQLIDNFEIFNSDLHHDIEITYIWKSHDLLNQSSVAGKNSVFDATSEEVIRKISPTTFSYISYFTDTSKRKKLSITYEATKAATVESASVSSNKVYSIEVAENLIKIGEEDYYKTRYIENFDSDGNRTNRQYALNASVPNGNFLRTTVYEDGSYEIYFKGDGFSDTSDASYNGKTKITFDGDSYSYKVTAKENNVSVINKTYTAESKYLEKSGDSYILSCIPPLGTPLSEYGYVTFSKDSTGKYVPDIDGFLNKWIADYEQVYESKFWENKDALIEADRKRREEEGIWDKIVTVDSKVGSVVLYDGSNHLVTYNSFTSGIESSDEYNIYKNYNTVKDSESRKKYLKEYYDVEEYIELYRIPDESSRDVASSGSRLRDKFAILNSVLHRDVKIEYYWKSDDLLNQSTTAEKSAVFDATSDEVVRNIFPTDSYYTGELTDKTRNKKVDIGYNIVKASTVEGAVVYPDKLASLGTTEKLITINGKDYYKTGYREEYDAYGKIVIKNYILNAPVPGDKFFYISVYEDGTYRLYFNGNGFSDVNSKNFKGKVYIYPHPHDNLNGVSYHVTIDENAQNVFDKQYYNQESKYLKMEDDKFIITCPVPLGTPLAEYCYVTFYKDSSGEYVPDIDGYLNKWTAAYEQVYESKFWENKDALIEADRIKREQEKAAEEAAQKAKIERLYLDSYAGKTCFFEYNRTYDSSIKTAYSTKLLFNADKSVLISLVSKQCGEMIQSYLEASAEVIIGPEAFSVEIPDFETITVDESGAYLMFDKSRNVYYQEVPENCDIYVGMEDFYSDFYGYDVIGTSYFRININEKYYQHNPYNSGKFTVIDNKLILDYNDDPADGDDDTREDWERYQFLTISEDGKTLTYTHKEWDNDKQVDVKVEDVYYKM